MKRIIFALTVILTACAVPDSQDDTAALALDPPATWGQVFDETVGYCLHVYSYGCAETTRWYWYGQCRDGAYALADEAEAAGCTSQAVGWMQCEQTQQFICWGTWPYQTTDYCTAESDAYDACVRDA